MPLFQYSAPGWRTETIGPSLGFLCEFFRSACFELNMRDAEMLKWPRTAMSSWSTRQMIKFCHHLLTLINLRYFEKCLSGSIQWKLKWVKVVRSPTLSKLSCTSADSRMKREQHGPTGDLGRSGATDKDRPPCSPVSVTLPPSWQPSETQSAPRNPRRVSSSPSPASTLMTCFYTLRAVFIKVHREGRTTGLSVNKEDQTNRAVKRYLI